MVSRRFRQQLSRLKAEGCTRILLLPLYPQYSASTTASVPSMRLGFLAAARAQSAGNTQRSGVLPITPATSQRWQRVSREHWFSHARPDRSYRLVMSFHGCRATRWTRATPTTASATRPAACLPRHWVSAQEQYQVCFQSRFGRAEWLQPYTAATLQALATQGVQRVDVICPGFPADCLETLEEIAIEGKSEFMQAGGREFHYLPCLNERDDWIHALADLAASHLQGWPTRPR
jgi:ferrochelatase